MLTGEVGAGKTTVCRHLTAQLHPGLYRVHYVSLSTGNVLDMYKAIGWELGIAVERSRSSAHHAIRIEVSRLAKEYSQRNRCADAQGTGESTARHRYPV